MVQVGAKSEIFFSSNQPTPLIQLILEHRSTILDQKNSFEIIDFQWYMATFDADFIME